MGRCVHEADEKWGGESKGADEKWGGESVTPQTDPVFTVLVVYVGLMLVDS